MYETEEMARGVAISIRLAIQAGIADARASLAVVEPCPLSVEGFLVYSAPLDVVQSAPGAADTSEWVHGEQPKGESMNTTMVKGKAADEPLVVVTDWTANGPILQPIRANHEPLKAQSAQSEDQPTSCDFGDFELMVEAECDNDRPIDESECDQDEDGMPECEACQNEPKGVSMKRYVLGLVLSTLVGYLVAHAGNLLTLAGAIYDTLGAKYTTWRTAPPADLGPAAARLAALLNEPGWILSEGDDHARIRRGDIQIDHPPSSDTSRFMDGLVGTSFDNLLSSAENRYLTRRVVAIHNRLYRERALASLERATLKKTGQEYRTGTLLEGGPVPVPNAERVDPLSVRPASR
jgi:hypothetical protein